MVQRIVRHVLCYGFKEQSADYCNKKGQVAYDLTNDMAKGIMYTIEWLRFKALSS